MQGRSQRETIAYQIVGDGPIDTLFVAEWLNHIDEQWEEPRLAGFLEGLSRFSRLILSSTRAGWVHPIDTGWPPADGGGVDGRCLAALDAAVSERAAVLGNGGRGYDCAPSRRDTSRPGVLAHRFNAGARTAWDDDHPIGMPRWCIRRALEQIAAYLRPGDAPEVVELPLGRRKSAPEQAFRSGAGWTRTSDRRIMSLTASVLPCPSSAAPCRSVQVRSLS